MAWGVQGAIALRLLEKIECPTDAKWQGRRSVVAVVVVVPRLLLLLLHPMMLLLPALIAGTRHG